MIPLNEAQARYLASSWRALGLGQLAAFGFVGVRGADWLTVAVSVGFLVLFELAALRLLRDVEDGK